MIRVRIIAVPMYINSLKICVSCCVPRGGVPLFILFIYLLFYVPIGTFTLQHHGFNLLNSFRTFQMFLNTSLHCVNK